MTPSFMIPPLCSEQGGDLACNRLTSALEVAEFCDERPVRAFVYIDEASSRATTWMGTSLGRVTFGREYRGGFGSRRVSIAVHAVNGRCYSGTYYKSSGSYARIRLVRGNNRAVAAYNMREG